MLTQLQSEVFRENGKQRQTIFFHKGLNAVIATENANNSTGKSSFLLAIDFAFAGSAYAEDEAKIIETVGHHVINFAFEFSGEKFFFSRSTADLNTVNVCTDKYEVTKSITIDEFKNFLCEKYGFEDSTLKFRAAISPYFRISHKSSKELSDFLSSDKRAKPRDCVTNFEKLFNRFSEIEEERAKAEDAKKANDTFKDAVKRKFINSTITKKSELKQAQKEVERLKSELLQDCKSNDERLISFDEKKSKELKELFGKYRKAASLITKLEDKIERAENSLKGVNKPSAEEIEVFKTFFPSADVKKLNAIEVFHSSLSSVLKSQIEEEIQRLNTDLSKALEFFESAKNEAEKALPSEFISRSAFEDYGKKYAQLEKLKEDIENYSKGKAIDSQDKEAKEELNKKEAEILFSIAEKINANIAALNAKVKNGEWQSPELKFTVPTSKIAKGISKYSLLSGNDKGDGTESASVMMFDLSVLRLTRLPAIIHDLFVRNELDKEREEECIKLYATETEKQIFTAFRSVKTYSKDLQALINANAVISLYANGGELYGTSRWVKN